MTSSPLLNLTLLLSSLPSSALAPFTYTLGSISLPPTLVVSDSARSKRKGQGGAGSTYPAFEVEEEIHPQMPAGEKEVSVWVSLLGVGAVLGPWFVLGGIVSVDLLLCPWCLVEPSMGDGDGMVLF